ncbi:MAG TPA: hypothetical protein VK327_18785, partial [Candidatus Paceibacterota bacterium]|nr:hypothetical protein [Candidatus Paceibacterota bacterium]
MGIFDMLFGGESPEEEIVREIGNIKTLLADLSSNMNYRFDRVDQSLTQIYSSLNERFDQIEITLDAQGRQIAHLNGDVDEIRLALLDAQTELFRIERNLATFQALDWRMNLVDQIKLARGFEARVTSPMEYTGNAPADFVSFESVFSTYAVDRASAETLSRCATLPFGDQFLYEQLAVGGGTNVYAETLNYVKKYLRGMGLTEFSEQPVLVNPQDWSTGAGAWLQLAVENPGHFRKYESDAGSPGRLDGIISKGRALTNFFGKLTFNGTNINWPVYAALENHYFRKLTNFTGQVRSVEQQVATERGFAIDRWRQWAASAPPSIHVTATKVSASPAMILPPATVWATQIVAGGNHNLALRSDGTIIAWGNHAEGATRIPPGLTNMLAVGAGQSHSLAIKPDHTVIAWGLNNYNQTNVPANVINVIAVSAGHFHSLALRADGTVAGWGAGTSVGAFPHFGQAQPPLDATNITALAGGGYHSLALRTDGTLLAWGLNNEGQLNIPADATNIVAIAGGHGHNMALRSNGTVVVWGNNLFNGVPVGITTIPAEATNIVAIAAAGWHCLALRSDGKVLAWGANDGRQCIVPPGLCDVQSLSAGLAHSVALKTDGSVVVWGNNDHRECLVPPSLTRQGALSEGGVHFLGLRTDGTVADYGFVADYANPVPPAEATNVVAIAAGAWHSL